MLYEVITAGYRTVLIGKYGLQGEGDNPDNWPATTKEPATPTSTVAESKPTQSYVYDNSGRRGGSLVITSYSIHYTKLYDAHQWRWLLALFNKQILA